jgi:hypothetical protein
VPPRFFNTDKQAYEAHRPSTQRLNASLCQLETVYTSSGTNSHLGISDGQRIKLPRDIPSQAPIRGARGSPHNIPDSDLDAELDQELDAVICDAERILLTKTDVAKTQNSYVKSIQLTSLLKRKRSIEEVRHGSRFGKNPRP